MLAPQSEDPGIVWFCGLNSEMTSTKVTALKDWAAQTDRSMLRFDYSGHGNSDGEFSDGTIGQWLNESLTVLRDVASGPQILIGSSMGAWLVLLILRAIARDDPVVADICKIEGAVLIAPAWDMTEELMWNQFSQAARAQLQNNGYFERPSRYGEGPYIISKKLIDEGRNHLIGDDSFKPPCPVRIIHGVKDPDVPWKHANKLTHTLEGENVMLQFIPDGDHRLSRDQDIAKLFSIVEDLYGSLKENRHYI
ncbi:MAG: alpha/beta hydrolase [Hyphomicrobiaceae bacterium]|nr:alpha/beta hydrolase [Hyphomicrobiaceae bacterium]